MHYIHRICGNVEKAEEGIYKITNINETIGDANTWGMSRFHSKNKICRRLLNAANISDSASYARGSLIMNIDDSGYAMGTAYGIFKSMKEITCYE